jgi:hypothetical protein
LFNYEVQPYIVEYTLAEEGLPSDKYYINKKNLCPPRLST